MSISGRETTVLFAGFTGIQPGASPLPTVIAHCVEVLQQAAEVSGGRVVKALGDEVMVLFATPDAAARAAARMHVYVESLPEARERLGVRIGFHCGPVGQRDSDDVFGDTVNLAQKLTEKAAKGQIVTTEGTAARLSPHIRKSLLPLPALRINATQEQIAVGELVWRQGPELCSFPMGEARATGQLTLTYRSSSILRRREGDSVVVGRAAGCDLVIEDAAASRQHCTIGRRSDTIVLRDHSTNGTFVTVQGEPEVRVHEGELVLRRRGWISLGQARSKTVEVIRYLCT